MEDAQHHDENELAILYRSSMQIDVDWLIFRESRDNCIEKQSFKRTNARQMCRKFRSRICQKKKF